jgi:hypothetical protein
MNMTIFYTRAMARMTIFFVLFGLFIIEENSLLNLIEKCNFEHNAIHPSVLDRHHFTLIKIWVKSNVSV